MLKKLVVLAVLGDKFFIFLLLFYISKALGEAGYGQFSYEYVIAAGVATVVGKALVLCLRWYSAQGESDYQHPTVIVFWGSFFGWVFSLLIAHASPLRGAPLDASVGAVVRNNSFVQYLIYLVCASTVMHSLWYGEIYSSNALVFFIMAIIFFGIIIFIRQLSVRFLGLKVRE